MLLAEGDPPIQPSQCQSTMHTGEANNRNARRYSRLMQHRLDLYSGAVEGDLPSGPAQHEVVSSRVQTHAAK